MLNWEEPSRLWCERTVLLAACHIFSQGYHLVGPCAFNSGVAGRNSGDVAFPTWKKVVQKGSPVEFLQAISFPSATRPAFLSGFLKLPAFTGNILFFSFSRWEFFSPTLTISVQKTSNGLQVSAALPVGMGPTSHFVIVYSTVQYKPSLLGIFRRCMKMELCRWAFNTTP